MLRRRYRPLQRHEPVREVISPEARLLAQAVEHISALLGVVVAADEAQQQVVVDARVFVVARQRAF